VAMSLAVGREHGRKGWRGRGYEVVKWEGRCETGVEIALEAW